MVWKLSPFCIPEGFFDIGEDGRTQTAWHVKCPGLSSAFFCIFLVVSVPKNTNLLGWYLTSRIGCLVEVLNCYSIYMCIDIQIHINICIYIHIVCIYCIYTLYTHSTHVPQRTSCRLLSQPPHATHRRLFTVHIPKSISFTCCEPGCGQVGDLFLDPRLGHFQKKNM